ncbi:RNA polymerase sigma factor [Sphingobacterium sp. LRF_L2]|uniref:RNA polymerase sigma factor n=1 Tax=Sphingobacterium sp. LRF_L2 TaxID=3369421 RepID=UPI003F5DFC71
MVLRKSIPENDTTLLKWVSEGNQLAFSQLYYRYHQKIFSFAYHILRSETLAEEVLQETMLKLWRLGEGLRKIDNLEAYLRVSSRNISLNLLRRIALEKKADLFLKSNYVDEDKHTEEKILLNDARRILEEAVVRLPPQQQMAFRLCHIDGLKYDEAAKKMGISAKTVAVHVKLALKFVRSYMRHVTDLMAILVVFRLF